MRPMLAQPLGRLFASSEVEGKEFRDVLRESDMIITVGDRTTETLGAMGRVPDVQVVDGREERRTRSPPEVPHRSTIEAVNPPGTLTTEAIEAVRKALSGPKPVRVLVDGEEDLVAIPMIALAPVSSLVLYGQPGRGVVAVKVEATSKQRSRSILEKIGVPPIL